MIETKTKINKKITVIKTTGILHPAKPGEICIDYNNKTLILRRIDEREFEYTWMTTLYEKNFSSINELLEIIKTNRYLYYDELYGLDKISKKELIKEIKENEIN